MISDLLAQFLKIEHQKRIHGLFEAVLFGQNVQELQYQEQIPLKLMIAFFLSLEILTAPNVFLKYIPVHI